MKALPEHLSRILLYHRDELVEERVAVLRQHLLVGVRVGTAAASARPNATGGAGCRDDHLALSRLSQVRPQLV